MVVFALSGRRPLSPRRRAVAGTVDDSRDRLIEGVYAMPVLRQVVGETLRALRLRQRRTLREVSASARVSLGYLSEVERGQKEPSSELLAAIAHALDVELSELFQEVSVVLRREEKLGGARLAAIPGAGSARIARSPATPQPGTTQLRAVRTVAA
jgi:transcriptional regulator with XRE-family HTH domain